MRRLGFTRFIRTAVVCVVLASWPGAVAQVSEGAAGSPTGDEVAASPEQAPIELVLRSDRETYAVGDVARYFARASEDCYLTLINVDPDGSAVVLFPNDFEQDNRLEAGGELMLPMQNSLYKFRLTRVGRERLIGICTQSSRPVAGIHHDFDRLQFTVLGNWDEFLARIANGQMGKAPSQPERRNKRRGARPTKKPEEQGSPAMPDRQARTEISYEVR